MKNIETIYGRKKLALIENIFVGYFVIPFMVLFLFSVIDTKSFQSKRIELIIVTSTVCLLLALLAKYVVKNIKLKYFIFTFAALLLFVASDNLSAGKCFIKIGGATGIFILLGVLMSSKKSIIAFSVVPIAIVVKYLIISPYALVEIGPDYYILVILYLIISALLAIKGIQLFSQNEAEIIDKVLYIEQKNQEMGELNEAYLATEEELRANYEEMEELYKNLQFSNKKNEAILNINNDGIIDVSLIDNTVSLNEVGRRILGYPEGELITVEKIDYLVKLNSDKRYWEKYNALKKGEIESFQLNIKSMRLEGVYYKVTMIRYDTATSKNIVASIKDITIEKEYERNLYDMAFNDPLTGLLNRNGFIQEISEELAPGSLIYALDIKDFKSINTTFGFSEGNKILKDIGIMLKDVVKEEFVIGRTGGNEYCIFCKGIKEPEEVLTEIKNSLENYYSDTLTFKIGINSGVARFEVGDTGAELIEKSEIAMYESKNCVNKLYTSYEEKDKKAIERRLKISSELEFAIMRDEIHLVYQPQVNTMDQTIIGYETLARWSSPSLGFVSPIEFITLAEKSGYINVLEDYIIDKACQFYKKAELNKRGQVLSINISGVHLLADGFEEYLLEMTNKYEIENKSIAIEVTETALIENLVIAKRILVSLRNHGFEVHLDDFGTGYSSLNYFAKMPLDVLKIDKSFIDSILHDEKQHYVVTYLISMARKSGIKVIAEGVEEQEQYELLKTLGCDYIQGYYFFKPLSDSEILEMIQ